MTRPPRPGTPQHPMDSDRFAAIVRSLVPDPRAAKLILGAAGEYAAHVAEEACRPWPWPPKAPYRGTGPKREAS